MGKRQGDRPGWSGLLGAERPDWRVFYVIKLAPYEVNLLPIGSLSLGDEDDVSITDKLLFCTLLPHYRNYFEDNLLFSGDKVS